MEVDLIIQAQTVQADYKLHILHELRDGDFVPGIGLGGLGIGAHLSSLLFSLDHIDEPLGPVEIGLSATGEQEQQVVGGLGLAGPVHDVPEPGQFQEDGHPASVGIGSESQTGSGCHGVVVGHDQDGGEGVDLTFAGQRALDRHQGLVRQGLGNSSRVDQLISVGNNVIEKGWIF